MSQMLQKIYLLTGMPDGPAAPGSPGEPLSPCKNKFSSALQIFFPISAIPE